jgi:hypothetical protein
MRPVACAVIRPPNKSVSTDCRGRADQEIFLIFETLSIFELPWNPLRQVNRRVIEIHDYCLPSIAL